MSDSIYAGDPHSDINRLSADGFLIEKGKIDRQAAEKILSVSHEHIRIVEDALGDRKIGIGSAAGFDEIVQRSPGRWDIPISPEQFGINERTLPWWPLVESVLGNDAEHTFSGVVYSDPETPAQCWHTDSPHESLDHLPPHALHVLVALHDVPMNMGPTEFARGSHVLTNHLQNTNLVSDELIYQHESTSPATLVDGVDAPTPEGVAESMSTGTFALFDDRIMHRGLANHSASARYMGYFGYRRKGYDKNTHFESRRSVFA